MPPKLSLINEDDDGDIDTPVVEKVCPPPPDWMSFEAKMEWMRAAPELFKRERLVGGLISLLENYCIVTGEIRECEQMLAADGKIVGGKIHPAYRMMLDAMNVAKSLAVSIKFEEKLEVEKVEVIEPVSEWDQRLLA